MFGAVAVASVLFTACGGGSGGESSPGSVARSVRADAVDFCAETDSYNALFRSPDPVPDIELRGKLMEVYAIAPPDMRAAVDRLNPYFDLLLEIRIPLHNQPNVALAQVAEEHGVDYGRELLTAVVDVANEIAAVCGQDPIGVGVASSSE